MEVLRRKRQLEAENRREGEVLRRQRRETDLAKEKSDDLDEVLEAGEVLLDQIERDVVRELELEQEFSHLMEEEEDQVIRILKQSNHYRRKPGSRSPANERPGPAVSNSRHLCQAARSTQRTRWRTSVIFLGKKREHFPPQETGCML